MKTISMDYEEYVEELEAEHFSGVCCGISGVMQYLESGKPFLEWCPHKPEDVSDNWKRILKALGRESELMP